jgi:hypothetical protein
MSEALEWCIEIIAIIDGPRFLFAPPDKRYLTHGEQRDDAAAHPRAKARLPHLVHDDKRHEQHRDGTAERVEEQLSIAARH